MLKRIEACARSEIREWWFNASGDTQNRPLRDTQNPPLLRRVRTLTKPEILPSGAMSNVLNHEKKQEVLALGRLGRSLRRIEQATGVCRETISTYLKAAGSRCGIRVGGWHHEPVLASCEWPYQSHVHDQRGHAGGQSERQRKSVFRTEQETSQPNRMSIEYWALGLEPIYLDEAFARAQGRLP